VKKLTLTIGAIESVAILLYGLVIVIRGTLEKSSLGSPLVQFIIYSIFAASLAACTWGISKNQNWARTPYYLLQLFIVVTGYTLLNGTLMVYKVVGVIVTAVGVAGFVALLRTPQEDRSIN
jgi:ABC-type polysaccharide/polyol phosphate export permease